MKLLKKLTLLGATLALSLGVAYGADFELRASSNLAATGTVGKALQKFVDLVNEKTQGRIEATANFGSELGSQSEQVEMCRIGALEMVVAAPGTGPGMWVPELMMFEFPFLVDNNEHYRRVLAGVQDEVSKRLEEYGFIAMAGQSQGARHMLTVKPVRSIADMKSLKMRGPNAIYIDMFKKLGAAGTTMDWNEIYTALQTNVIDGMEASPSMIHSMHFEDEAKYMAITNHIIACVYYFFNKDWFSSLPDDLKKIVSECADEAAIYQAQLDDEDQIKALEAMKQSGLNVTYIEDIQKWKDACAPMLEEYKHKGENWSSFIEKIESIK
ncbi:MAG: TRAP transporter substrate-binding protein [Succinatimonas sp.]|nr:TRAP transporter substrate-binding protein [Succinatimonas sp.]